MAFTMKMLIDGIKQLGDHANKWQKRATEGDPRMGQMGYDVAKAYQERLRKYAPKKSGDMAASIIVTSKKIGAWTIVVAPEVAEKEQKKMEWVVDGTPAHWIEAKRTRFLRWEGVDEDGEGDGTFIFRKKVYHPGTAPNEFQAKAQRQTTVEAKKKLGDLVKIVFGDL